MHTRQGAAAPPPPPQPHQNSRPPFRRYFLSIVAVCAIHFFQIGCAAPGEPTERRPPIPLPVADLAAQQDGDSVALTFTLPTETVDHKTLDQPPAVEIYRQFEPSPASSASATSSTPVPSTTTPASKSASNATPPATLLVTIPSATVGSYATQDHFRYLDTLTPDDFSQHPHSIAVYAVRTRASLKKNSASSNVASVFLYPLPSPIDDLKAEVTHSGIQLTWTPPTRTPVGPAGPISSYRIYRADAQPAPSPASTAPESSSPQSPSPQSQNASNSAAPNTKPASAAPLTKIGESSTPHYLDTKIQFGDAYIYSVRSVVNLDGHELESADSSRLTILARDTFPPATPEGLLVVFVPAQANEPAHLELSWRISTETDLAGYNVYRSDQVGVLGTRINTELLPTPSFQDMNAMPGRTYFYSVTAVDRSGNESAASAAISGTVPAEGQPTP